MSETGSDTRSGIGARLRAGREKMGFTLLQAAEKLHVDAKVIESLESERFDLLGAPVFVRGHLRHYAELINEPIAPLIELYTASTQAALPDLTKLPKAAPESSPSRLAVPALVVLIGFVLLGVVWWIVQSVGKSGESTRESAAQPVAIDAEVSFDPDVAQAVPDAMSSSEQPPMAGAAPRGNGQTSAPSAARAAGAARGAPPAATAARPGAGTTATSTTPAATATTAAPVAGASDAPTPAPVRGKAMEVTLRFASDSWVEVYDANGEKLFYDVGSADSSHTISGTPPFRVTVANSPGVTLDVNGKPVKVPASTVKDDQAQFVINRAGRIVRARDGG